MAADFEGAAYFHNVRVNGILQRATGPTLSSLVALLNSRAVDYAFRRRAAPLANGFFTANKQFISWLPVPEDLPDELDGLGWRLHETSAAMEHERASFFQWLESVFGVPPRGLPGFRNASGYALSGPRSILAFLDAKASLVSADPTGRALRQRVAAETEASVARLGELSRDRAAAERDADDLVMAAYRLPSAARSAIDGEYGN